MSSTTTLVRVALGERSYDIEIGTGNLVQTGDFLVARRPTKHVVVITDANVEPHFVDPLAQGLDAAGIAIDLLVIEPGEAMKSVETANFLWQKLHELGADRKTVMIALGGGVVGDLAGFVAASYARGLGFLQIPTTLLADVDSSVGGKVGVNLPQGKNMVGAFWQPIGVICDTSLLATLPEREYRSGLAEVAKYGVIMDADFFAYLESHVDEILAQDHDVLQHIIAKSCRLKADVVEQDEREETGRRAILNYGHTFGHACESLTNYAEFLHGEAISIGMHFAARLAAKLGRVDEAFVERQAQLLTALKLPIAAPNFPVDRVLALMARDKKALHGRLNFVLPTKLGHVELVQDIDPKLIRTLLA